MILYTGSVTANPVSGVLTLFPLACYSLEQKEAIDLCAFIDLVCDVRAEFQVLSRGQAYLFQERG